MEEQTFEPLTDGTISLRRPTEDDAEQIAALIRSSYQHITPWMVWAKPDHGVDDALVWIRRESDPTSHPFMIFDSEQRYVGSAGMDRVDQRNLTAEIGYWLAPEATGFGHATRATNLLLRYAIEQAGMYRAEIWIAAPNEASRKVAERSHAIYDATLRQCFQIEGQPLDGHCYAFIKGDPFV